MITRRSRSGGAACDPWRRAALIAALLVLALAAPAQAVELQGRVVEVRGTEVRIEVEGGLMPQVGDQARIAFRLPGGAELRVGTWRVMRIEGDAILASVVEATGTPAPGQTATISSANPVPRAPAASAPAPRGAGAPPAGSPWLGVSVQSLNEEAARDLGLAAGLGALVTQTAPDSPAQRAGLVPRDVIVAYDGSFIADPASLSRLVRGSPVGTPVDLVVVRGRAAYTVRVTIGPRPASP